MKNSSQQHLTRPHHTAPATVGCQGRREDRSEPTPVCHPWERVEVVHEH